MKKMLFLAAVGLLFATGSADAKSVKLGATDDGADREISIKKRPTLTCKGGKILKDGKCVSCSDEVSHCKTCSAESKCLRCETNYALKADGTCGCANDSVCEDQQYCWKKDCTPLTCKKGFYGKNHKCNACPAGCVACDSEDSCTECKRGYYLKNGACVPCSEFSSEYSNCRACTESGCTECDGDGPEDGKCVDCSDDDSCAGSQKCSDNKCEELDCGPVAPQDHTCPVCADYGYTTTACGDSYNTVDQNFSASDGACHTCELKTCEQLGYATACDDGQTKEAAGVSGSDGACYSCKDPDPECSADTDCGGCQTCSGGKCVDLSCGEGKVCDNNHGCKDKDPGPEPGTCSSDCDCQWWEVCSNKKCVKASSCESLDACNRSKGQGGNYRGSNSGSCSVVPNKTYINVANLYCYVCPKEGNNTPKCEDGKKLGQCTYTYNDSCPSGWNTGTSNWANIPSCKICNPPGTYNGENCSGGSSGGGGQNCSCTSKTSGSVSNGSKICFYGSTSALNAKGCQNLSSSTMTLKCTYKGLSGVLSILTCTGCSPTVTCTHQYGGGTFTVTNVQYEPTLVCDGPNGCKQM